MTDMVKNELIKTKIPWTPYAPIGWDIKRAKFIFKSKKEINSQMQCNDRLALTLKGVIDRFEGDNIGLNPNDLRTYQIFQPNELVFKLLDLDNKKTSRVGFVHKKGIMSSAYIRVLENPNMNMRYFYYQYFDLYQRFIFNDIGQGVRATMSSSDLLNIPILIPPLETQNAIVNYLDRKTQQIQEFIQKKERLIELLEEKRKVVISTRLSFKEGAKTYDTKIDWIGEIPDNWKVLNLKYLLKAKLKYGANEEAKDANINEPRYIRITDFGFDGKLHEDTFRSLPLKKAKDYLLEEGDILFARSGATVGKAFQFKNYNGVACFAGYLIKATPKENEILSDFLYLYTQSSFFETWKSQTFNQATIENIGADKYAVLKVIVPPIAYQSEIIKQAKNDNLQFEKVISKAQIEIEKAKEYQESLITQVVSGQLKVPEKTYSNVHYREFDMVAEQGSSYHT